MKENQETALRSLDEATAAGDRGPEGLDEDTASLREAWLAFGEMLEAAQPASLVSPRLSEVRSATKAARMRRRWQRLLTAGLLAASLLVATATIWMLSGGNHPGNSAGAPKQMAGTNPKVAPLQKGSTKSVAAADAPQWDDSLDEQFEQVGWRMLCVQENQAFRTDAFEHAQYRLEQLRETIQADSL
jgi:hypothetical protein